MVTHRRSRFSGGTPAMSVPVKHFKPSVWTLRNESMLRDTHLVKAL